jgi:hypothetical protein
VSDTDKEPYRYLSEEEAKKVAQELVNNLIFCSDQVHDARDVGMVFMVLNFLEKKDIDLFREREVVHFYEYLKDAMPRAVNGMPTFMNARPLTKSDYIAVREYEEKLRTAMKEALK